MKHILIFVRSMTLLLGLALVSACATTAPQPYDYAALRANDPHSILVVPVVNNSNEADAADYFLSTLTYPLAERGFYVFPVNMVKRVMEEDGLGDAGMVHQADPVRVAELFDADSVLFVEINKWDSGYQVFASSITVGFHYRLIDGQTGELLWQRERDYVHSRSSDSGNILGDLIANAITSAVDSMSSDYTNLARAANRAAIYAPNRGLPAGPYSPRYKQDGESYPVTGTAWVGAGDPPAAPTASSAGEAAPAPKAKASEPAEENSGEESSGDTGSGNKEDNQNPKG